MLFKNIEKEMGIIFAELEDKIGEINIEKQRSIIHKRLININLNICAELESRKSYVLY